MRIAHRRTAASTVKVVVIILICVGVLGVLVVGTCIGVGFFAFKTVSKELTSAQAAADTFFDQIVAGQFQAAYQSTTADYQAQSTLAQFTGFVGLHPNLKNHSSRSTAGFQMHTVAGGKQATLPYTLNGPAGATNCTVILLDDGSGWKVHRLTVP